MSRSFKIITLGCKVNQYESAYLAETLVREGWREAWGRGSADAVIVNTCVVTQRAAHQSRQALRKAVRENPHGLVAAVGCYPQVFPEVISKIPGVGVIAGNVGKGNVSALLHRAADSGAKLRATPPFTPGMAFETMPIRSYAGRTRAFLKIQDGCQSFCTYCIVPFARGPSRSLPASEVLHGLQVLCEGGYREVVLTGVHLGNYGLDLPGTVNLRRLLRDIGQERFPIRIRLSSLEPNEIRRDLVEMVGAESWLCPHFHIPLQSGDDRILNRMNRAYTRDAFAKLIGDIQEIIPEAAIGVDVMAGFPGEEATAHKNTCSLVSDLPISYLHVFPYSARPGTAAATFADPVDPHTIKQRAAELRTLGQRKRDLFYRSCLNRSLGVLVENWSSEEDLLARGTSENYVPVLFRSSRNREGEIVTVRAAAVQRGRILGSVLGEDR